MIIGFYCITEVTIDTDMEIYYGPTKASSTVVQGGKFRWHIIPDHAKNVLLVSRDFAGVTVDREAFYSIEEAIKIKLLQPVKSLVHKNSNMNDLVGVEDQPIPAYKSKKSKKKG